MKTSYISKLAVTVGLTLGVALLASLATRISAGEFKGGAQKLMPPASVTVIPSASKVVACPKCTTELVERSIVQMKATGPKTEFVGRHLCNGCETTIAVEGFGKARQDVATHKCNSCGVASLVCCSTAPK